MSNGPAPCSRPTANPSCTSVPLGSGQLAKLVNNVIFTAHLTVADDALALGEAWGLDRAALAQVLTAAARNSYALPIVAGMGFEQMRAAAGPLLRKDVDIVTTLAAETGAPTGAFVAIADHALTRMRQPPTAADPGWPDPGRPDPGFR